MTSHVFYPIFLFVALAIYDSLFLVCLILNDGVPFWIFGSELVKIMVYYPVTLPFDRFAYTGITFLTVLLSAERCIVIVYPESSKKWCSLTRTRVYIFGKIL